MLNPNGAEYSGGSQLSERNRSQGWQHAKVDGHKNESQLGLILESSAALSDLVHESVFGVNQPTMPEVKVDGLSYVDSIFGGKTISKVDILMSWSESHVGLSVKKSNSGQVWLVSLERFLTALRHSLDDELPNEVEYFLKLFIGGNNLTEMQDEFAYALRKTSGYKWHQQQIRQNRLVFEGIREAFPDLAEAMLKFLKCNITLITDLMFFRGLAANENDFADAVIYNKITEGQNIFTQGRLLERVSANRNISLIGPGPLNGGSTIILPTGFLQMHHPAGENLLQFHHNYERMLAAVSQPSKSAI